MQSDTIHCTKPPRHSTKTCHFRTQPRGYENSINALDGVTDAGHHRVDLLGEVVLSVQAETLLLLELLESIGSLTGSQCGAILDKNEKDIQTNSGLYFI